MRAEALYSGFLSNARAAAPILFCKACESMCLAFHKSDVLTRSVVLIAEITARAFIVADANKRRTLSRSDIAKALAKSDQFDFLIDIVPREEPFPGGRSKKKGGDHTAGPSTSKVEGSLVRLGHTICDHCNYLLPLSRNRRTRRRGKLARCMRNK